MKKSRLAMIGLLVTALPFVHARADDTDEPTRYYGYGSIGSFNGPNRVGNLTNGGDGVALNAGLGRRFNRYLAGEGDIAIAGQTFDAAGYEGGGEPTVGYISLAYSLKASLPRKSFRPFVTAGVGIFQADVQLVTESSNGLGYTGEPLASDKGLETRLGVGVDFRAGRKWWLGLEFREISAEADFGTPRKIDLSASSVVFAYRRELGRPISRENAHERSP